MSVKKQLLANSCWPLAFGSFLISVMCGSVVMDFAGDELALP
jgi:hypothetical protein